MHHCNFVKINYIRGGYLVEGKALGTSDSKPAETTSPGKAGPKKKTKTLAIVGAILVIILVMAVVLSGSNNSPKPEFTIESHGAYVEANTTYGFNATVWFIVNNTGSVAGNATVIFKVINGSYTWAGAQIFYLVPGQSIYSYKKQIPVSGDPNSDWVYQCYLNGQKAIKYPHD